MQKTTAKTVDAYLASQPADVQATLSKVRKAIRAAAPKAEEKISYHMPLYKYHIHLVGFCAFTNHCSFFPMSHAVMKMFAEELKDYDTSGATIRFPVGKPLPATLIKKIVAARIIENDEIAAKRAKKKSAKKAAVKKAARKKVAPKKKAASR
ncbi:DUF1801 domain-containing protein [Terrimonas sp. NA20]|uniref:DUF1801 domain-containing protein n=1 Tax=Terrimonas ginsenosidimutans TaxID=2908004 RepID=A0ABS9KJZ7_9BACT|nr:DUF1801 domain-containing protein [Terrimonas ginsenosidimutans]MCG2612639.1 DUF1801 domain-containing protein [Terrimonas ginsenosidimutans]